MSAGNSDTSPRRAPGELLAVARLFGPHGLNGEIRASALVPDVIDFPALLFSGKPLYARRDDQILARVSPIHLRPHGPQLLLSFEGFEDRTQAELLKGAELCMARADLPQLPEGWFWEDDLLGLAVEDAARGQLGRTESLDTVAGRWLLGVALDRGGRIQIPWVKRLVLDVDLQSRKIRVDLPLDYPGLD